MKLFASKFLPRISSISRAWMMKIEISVLISYSPNNSYYLIRKRERKARSPRNSANARAISMFDLISLAAFGFRPIAFMAPRPISPIPIPGPIRAIRAIPFARDMSSIIENVKKYKNPGNQEGTTKHASLFYF